MLDAVGKQRRRSNISTKSEQWRAIGRGGCARERAIFYVWEEPCEFYLSFTGRHLILPKPATAGKL